MTDQEKKSHSAEADVVIVGAGPGGIGAALMSARAGANTLVLEQYGVPGGMATVGEVTPFMCSFHHGETLDAPVYGEWRAAMRRYLPPEIVERQTADPEGYAARGINKEAAALAAEDLLLESGVRILYHHQLVGVEMSGREISLLRCYSCGHEISVRGKCFVDCTGNGELASLAKCRCDVGDEKGACQPMTLCFKLSHVETGWNRENSAAGIFELREKVLQSYLMAQKRGEIRCPRQNVLLFSFELADDSVVHFNTTRVVNHDPTDGASLSDAEIVGRRQLREILQWLRRDIPEFRNCRLMSMGTQIGIRESRHVRGIARLTEADFRNCSRFPDAIARCAYAIDVHSPTGSGTRLEPIAEGSFYEIPYGCIVPEDCDNLTVGGRPISADSAIHSSFRIMPTAVSIGQAAGLAAAFSAQQGKKPRDLDGKTIRNALNSLGAKLQEATQ